jgi:protein involved in polysaccharide export with SLBB domain
MNKMEDEKMRLEFAKFGLIYNSEGDTTLQEYIDLVEVQKWEIIEKSLRLPPVWLYGQEFFRRNKLKTFNENSNTNVPETYVIGSGDEITINVYGNAEYNENLVVDETGSIKTSVIGWINVKGLTVSRARQVIKSRLGTSYDLKKSTVDVRITSSATLSINVVGEVFNPGTYRMSSSNSAFNILVEMEGPNQTGSVRKMYIKRDGKTVKTLDVYKYLQDPNANMDFFVENNDYIVVPLQGNIVHIGGAVKRSANYEMLDNETLFDILKYSGGFKSNAFKNSVTIKRYTDKEVKFLTINMSDEKSNKSGFRLMNGDSIFISTINTSAKNYIYMMGTGGDRVSDAIKKAGGLAERAYTSTAFIIRINENLSKKLIHIDLENAINSPYSEADLVLNDRDTIQVFSSNSFRSSSRIGVYGAVRTPGEFDYGEGITIADLILMGGGMNVEAAGNKVEVFRLSEFEKNRTSKTPNREKIFEVNISPTMKLDELAFSFVLKPYDQIIVRTKPTYKLQKNIQVNGEVVSPGPYPLENNNDDLYTIVQRAGGLTDVAYVKGISVYRMNNEGMRQQIAMNLKSNELTKELLHNIKLVEGDSVVVPPINQIITLKGSINYIVDYDKGELKVPYEAGKSSLYYIQKYGGGFSKTASRKRTALIQLGGQAQYPLYFVGLKLYPTVENGATIEVPQKWKYEHSQFYLLSKAKNSKPIDWTILAPTIATTLTTLTLVIANILKK